MTAETRSVAVPEVPVRPGETTLVYLVCCRDCATVAYFAGVPFPLEGRAAAKAAGWTVSRIAVTPDVKDVWVCPSCMGKGSPK